MYKFSSLERKNQKGAIAFFDETVQTTTIERYHLFLATAIRKYLKESDFLNQVRRIYKIKLFFEQEIPEEAFDTNKERDEIFDKYARALDADIEKFRLSHKVVCIAPSDVIEVAGEEISVKGDLLLENSWSRTVIKFETKSLKTKKKADEEAQFLNLLRDKYGVAGKAFEATVIFLKEARFDSKAKESYWATYSGDTHDAISSIIEALAEEVAFDPEACGGKCFMCEYKALCTFETGSLVSDFEKMKEEVKSSTKVSPTSSQQKVIDFLEGMARVNAVAGSGKTTTMSLRVLEMLKAGERPEEIMMVTYTNKGALEMKSKIEKLVKYEPQLQGIDLSRMSIGTYHAFGQTVIESEYDTIGFDEVPTVIDEVERIDLILNLIDKHPKLQDFRNDNPLLGLPNAKGIVFEVQDIFAQIKSRIIKDPEDLMGKRRLSKGVAIQLFDMYEQYNEALFKAGYIEFADMIDWVIHVFETEGIVEYYTPKHIIIDEFQDSSHAELAIVEKFLKTGKVKSFMIVGDDDQSIYSFKNADASIIQTIHKRYPQIVDFNIEENFRSTEKITNLANSIARCNKGRINKTILPFHKGGRMPELRRFFSEQDEVDWMVAKIGALVDQGYQLGEIAILARTQRELQTYSGLLNAAGIPSMIIQKENVAENSHFHAIRFLAEALVDPGNDLAVLGCLVASEGKQVLNLKTDELIRKMDTARATMCYHSNRGDKAQLGFFWKTVGDMTKDNPMLNDFVSNIRGKKFGTMLEVEEYLSKMKRYGVSVKSNIEPIESLNAVKLITAHSSKGKEFEVVLGSLRKFPEKRFSNEDFRLLYVLVTRAKKELYLFSRSKQLKTKTKDTLAYTLLASEIDPSTLIVA